jgi:hypothetical protein
LLLTPMNTACDTEEADRHCDPNHPFHARVLRRPNNQRADETHDDPVDELHLSRRRSSTRQATCVAPAMSTGVSIKPS